MGAMQCRFHFLRHWKTRLFDWQTVFEARGYGEAQRLKPQVVDAGRTAESVP